MTHIHIPQKNKQLCVVVVVVCKKVSLLFEVEDLAVASPATVSRCGMVFNDWKDLGWQPFVTSWLSKKQEKDKDKVCVNIEPPVKKKETVSY